MKKMVVIKFKLVIKKTAEHGLDFNFKKFLFCKSEIVLLGYKMSKGCLLFITLTSENQSCFIFSVINMHQRCLKFFGINWIYEKNYEWLFNYV